MNRLLINSAVNPLPTAAALQAAQIAQLQQHVPPYLAGHQLQQQHQQQYQHQQQQQQQQQQSLLTAASLQGSQPGPQQQPQQHQVVQQPQIGYQIGYFTQADRQLFAQAVVQFCAQDLHSLDIVEVGISSNYNLAVSLG